ncbi:hypothetical protein OIB37_22565 [Streptomyces sp. NBC_00820]|uniref:hypothetical protein n=1 Tax=Streptomyces sp. NBC_00820 TaxID=2975842 RepID=UPI002ED231A1|nr:hypothetical protein OIB37_22565 [Streptomyces sp. NBC_00820]
MANARRQFRSTTVVLGGMGLLAAALTACSSEPDKRCVDRGSYNLTKGYKVVSDKNCKSAKSAVNGAWYYNGKKKGSWIDGGSFVKPSKGSSGRSSRYSDDDSDSHRTGVHRGGFGGGHGSSGG